MKHAAEGKRIRSFILARMRKVAKHKRKLRKYHLKKLVPRRSFHSSLPYAPPRPPPLLFESSSESPVVTKNLIPHQFRMKSWKGTVRAHCPVVLDHVTTLVRKITSGALIYNPAGRNISRLRPFLDKTSALEKTR